MRSDIYFKIFLALSRRVTPRQGTRHFTNNGTDQYAEMVHHTSLFHIESNLDRLGLLSPTHAQQRYQQQSGQITSQ